MQTQNISACACWALAAVVAAIVPRWARFQAVLVEIRLSGLAPLAAVKVAALRLAEQAAQ
jgi:hypothetical protein